MKIFWTPLGFEADAATEPNCPSNEPKDESVKPLVGISFTNEKLLVGTFSHYCVLQNVADTFTPKPDYSISLASLPHKTMREQNMFNTFLSLLSQLQNILF